MQPLTSVQLKKLEKLAKVGDIGIADELNALEGKIEALEAIVPALREARDGEVGPMGPQGEKGESIKGDKGETGRDGRDGKDSTVPGPVGPRGETGPQGVPGVNGVDGKDGDIKDLSPQEIRDSLELLQGDERIDVSSIRGVEDVITEIAEEIAKKEAKKVEGNTTVFTRVSSTGGATTTGGAVWGGITGTLSDQTDLNTVLGTKSDTSHTHTGVYEPADATILKDADIGVTVAAVLGADDNYVTDAEKTVIGNTSGTNTGDNAVNTLYSGLEASKQDVLTGLTASVVELNYTDGVTSAIQTQLDNKLDDTQFSGLSKITVGTSAPGSPATGDLWVDTN